MWVVPDMAWCLCCQVESEREIKEREKEKEREIEAQKQQEKERELEAQRQQAQAADEQADAQVHNFSSHATCKRASYVWRAKFPAISHCLQELCSHGMLYCNAGDTQVCPAQCQCNCRQSSVVNMP